MLTKNTFTFKVQILSKVCGTCGSLKLNKVGMTLFHFMFSDDVISNYTWRGISGSNKLAFFQYHNTRKLIFKVLLLADKNCSYIDVDAFLQNSAIKHCSQRLKRFERLEKKNAQPEVTTLNAKIPNDETTDEATN